LRKTGIDRVDPGRAKIPEGCGFAAAPPLPASACSMRKTGIDRVDPGRAKIPEGCGFAAAPPFTGKRLLSAQDRDRPSRSRSRENP
jgi:hypothetical protein